MAESLLVSNLFNIKGIVAVVTGGGSGLGLSITRALAVNGAKRVFILGRRIDVLELAAKEIGLNNVIPIQCDITNQQQLKSTVASIENDVGYINLLVANSGIAGPSGNVPADASISQVQEALYKIPMEEFTNTLHVNSTGVFYTIVAFLSLLDAGNKDGTYQNGRSQVITTSSIGGFSRKITAGFAYSTSKAATTMLMKVLATYLVPYRIRANIICPGLFPTDLTASLIDGKEPTEEGAFPLDKIPAERAGLPEDIVGPVLYLASRAGAYCNGNCVITDGGKLSVTPATY
ncbi:Short-chain dehydrogenase/reductase SAT3 [Penicillium brevicompactum]|uniref:Short-chain dehydrogenase/reductase SAT3 n=1 Tax=Penicillium brevicompactum TaxID=5074 RepID=A0A9W9UZZ3_PENBR|nr:Short-chain dehydrogenase/reductase SAT3 [Penicillium brevicompactum]